MSGGGYGWPLLRGPGDLALVIRATLRPGASETWAPCGKSEVPVSGSSLVSSLAPWHSGCPRGRAPPRLGPPCGKSEVPVSSSSLDPRTLVAVVVVVVAGRFRDLGPMWQVGSARQQQQPTRHARFALAYVAASLPLLVALCGTQLLGRGASPPVGGTACLLAAVCFFPRAFSSRCQQCIVLLLLLRPDCCCLLLSQGVQLPMPAVHRAPAATAASACSRCHCASLL